MNEETLRKLEEHTLAVNMLHIAFETLEKVPKNILPHGLLEGWIEDIREEAGFQVMHHDELREDSL